MIGRLKAWWSITRDPLWFWITLYAMETKPRSFSRTTASARMDGSTAGTAATATRGHDVEHHELTDCGSRIECSCGHWYATQHAANLHVEAAT